jgi:hypothetical protein
MKVTTDTNVLVGPLGATNTILPPDCLREFDRYSARAPASVSH